MRNCFAALLTRPPAGGCWDRPPATAGWPRITTNCTSGPSNCGCARWMPKLLRLCAWSNCRPAWFCRRPRPLFGGSETAVQETLAPVQAPALIQFGEEGPPQAQPDPLGFPALESLPTRAGADAEVSGQIPPPRARAEDPKDRLEHHAVRFRRPAGPPSLGLGQQRLDLLRLCLADRWRTHGHCLANAPERYKSNPSSTVQKHKSLIVNNLA